MYEGRPVNDRLYRVAIAAVILVSACGNPPAGSAPAVSPSAPPAAPSPTAPPSAAAVSPVVEASIALDGIFYDVAAGPEGVWLLSPAGRAISIDRITNAISADVSIPVSEFGNIAVGDGSVWVTDFVHNTLIRIDPTARNILATIPVGDSPEGIEVTDSAVYVANHRGGSVSKVDPATNKVVATFDFTRQGPSGPKDIVVLAGDIWTTVPNSESLYRLDHSTGDIISKIIIPGDLSSPITDGTFIYVLNGVNVVRVDPATSSIDHGFTGGNMPLAYGQFALWTQIDRDLARLDPVTLKPAATWTVLPLVDTGKSATGVAVDDTSVWMSIEGRTLLRVTPTR